MVQKQEKLKRIIFQIEISKKFSKKTFPFIQVFWKQNI